MLFHAQYSVDCVLHLMHIWTFVVSLFSIQFISSVILAKMLIVVCRRWYSYYFYSSFSYLFHFNINFFFLVASFLLYGCCSGYFYNRKTILSQLSTVKFRLCDFLIASSEWKTKIFIDRLEYWFCSIVFQYVFLFLDSLISIT